MNYLTDDDIYISCRADNEALVSSINLWFFLGPIRGCRHVVGHCQYLLLRKKAAFRKFRLFTFSHFMTREQLCTLLMLNCNDYLSMQPKER